MQRSTFRLLGVEPVDIDLSELLEAIKSGALQAEENPFSNMVTYGIHRYLRYYTASNRFYVSRPIFVHRPTFDAWSEDFRKALSSIVGDAVRIQREEHDREEDEAIRTIQEAGGQISVSPRTSGPFSSPRSSRSMTMQRRASSRSCGMR